MKVGDSVELEVLEGTRPTRRALIAGLVTDYTEPAAYMELSALHRLMREDQSLSGAFLAVDSRALDELYVTLKRTPKIASVNVKNAALVSFQKTLAENLLRMRAINLIFASILVVGVVYNSARIALAERSRELATLRVLGFTRQEVSRILLGELAVLTLTAIPLGLALGYAFAGAMTRALETETQRFPFVVSSYTFGLSVTVVVLAAAATALIVRRNVDRLELVSVLKAKE
jgi:putative ABC transport system permease protein